MCHVAFVQDKEKDREIKYRINTTQTHISIANKILDMNV